jgi:hypothetical protein
MPRIIVMRSHGRFHAESRSGWAASYGSGHGQYDSIVATWPTVNSVSELESPVKYRGDPAPGPIPGRPLRTGRRAPLASTVRHKTGR